MHTGILHPSFFEHSFFYYLFLLPILTPPIMLASMKSAIVLLLTFSLASAAQERLILTAGEAIRNCNRGGRYNDPSLFWTHDSAKSAVHVEVIGPVDAKKSSKWDLNVAVISTTDLDATGFYSMSDCRVGKSKKDCNNHFRYSKSFGEVISQRLNSISIDTFNMSSESSDNAVTLSVDPMVNYCVIISLITPDRDCELAVDVEWQKTNYGGLTEENFPLFYSHLFLSIMLFLGSAFYYRYVFVKKRSAATDHETEVDWTVQLRRKEIQVRILIFMILESCDRFANANEVFWANMFGYPDTGFAAKLMDYVSSATGLVALGWRINNLLLFSAGYLLIPKSVTGRQLGFIRFFVLCNVGFISFMIFDPDASHTENLLADTVFSIMGLSLHLRYIYGLYWSIKTYSRLRSTGGADTTRRYLKTFSLYFFAYFFHEFVPIWLGEGCFQKEHPFLWSIDEVGIAFITAYLWKDAVIESEKSWVWNWFVQDDLDLDVAICDQCGQLIRGLAGEKDSTKMLTDHLRMHQIDRETANPNRQLMASVNGSAGNANIDQTPLRPSLTQGGYASLPRHVLCEFDTGPYTEVKFHKELMRFLSENDLPITVVKSPAFRQIVFTLRPESIADLDDLEIIYGSFVDVLKKSLTEECS